MDNLDKLLYSTIKINVGKSSGTGFFFKLKHDRGESILLVTCRHVVEQLDPHRQPDFSIKELSQSVRLRFHVVGDKTIQLSLSVRWFLHPSEDLSFCFADDVLKEFLNIERNFKYTVLDERNLPNEIEVKNFFPVQRVLMIGYPHGLSDEYNNFPILRTGHTASDPRVSYNGKEHILIDVSVNSGSSGSPVFLSRDDNIKSIAQKPLLGGIITSSYITAQPIHDLFGRKATGLFTMLNNNLGLCIKASKLLDFKDIINSMSDFN